MTGGSGRARVIRLGARRELAVVLGFAIFTMLVVGVGATFASRYVAQQQALKESERTTERMARLTMAPLLPGYWSGEPALVDRLNQTIAQRMSDGYLTEVTVWQADGRVLYSADPELVGDVVTPVPAEVGRAIRGETSSAFEENEPEAVGNGATTGDGGGSSGETRYVEVYVPLTVSGQPPLAFEAYFNYERVDDVANELLRTVLPLVVVPLLLLQLIQIPAALSLARRLKRHERERARLLERAITVSDRERVRFAADLHDGPIQDLAGMSYALGALAPSVSERHAPLMGRVQDALHRSIASLRTLMTDLYPPDLGSGNLAETIHTLSEPLRANDVDVRVRIDELPPLEHETTAALYRVVRESIANIGKHAQASVVDISIAVVEGRRGPDDAQVRLVVQDDGVGLEPSKVDRRHEGHLGLRLLSDRVETLGGQMLLTSALGEGTRVQVEMPLNPGAQDDGW